MLLVIDNYDSFTYNLVHYLGELGGLGADAKVVRNDKISVDEVKQLNPDAILLSPGPCDPDQAGICLDLIAAVGAEIPMLGVCLGHQSMGQSYGGKVVRAPYVMHGKMSDIQHEGQSVFRDLPNPFEATRYHSLIVDRDSLPDCLEVTAQTEDGLIMGLAHKTHPIHGVQFHPESIASQHGHDLLRNFITIAEAFNKEHRS